MRSFWSVVLFLAHASMALAQADLDATSSASPSTGLWLGDEVLVSTTVRNLGPGSATQVKVGFSGRIEDGFYFHVVRSESPECGHEALDIDPPRFNYQVTFPPLAAGASHTCVMRLVVFDLPMQSVVRHAGSVRAGTPDPNPGNNAVAVDFVFGSDAIRSPHPIPAHSLFAIALTAILIAALGLRNVRA